MSVTKEHKMNRTAKHSPIRATPWLLIGVALLILQTEVRAAQAPARPNILFIFIDDLRWDALRSTGHPFAQTPNLDRLAQEGARFRNAFVTTPLCSPSRATVLTG